MRRDDLGQSVLLGLGLGVGFGLGATMAPGRESGRPDDLPRLLGADTGWIEVLSQLRDEARRRGRAR